MSVLRFRQIIAKIEVAARTRASEISEAMIILKQGENVDPRHFMFLNGDYRDVGIELRMCTLLPVTKREEVDVHR